MSDRRLSAVKAAFQYLDTARSGLLSVNDLLNRFQAGSHPRVVTREKTSETVLAEFRSSISKYSQGDRLSEEGFLSYYSSLNATIPKENDEYFVNLLSGCWSINSGRDYVTPQRLSQIDDIFYEKIRQKTKSTEDEGKVMIRLFRFFDTDCSGGISLNEFKSALERLGCVFNDTEINALFNKYNTSGSGRLIYEELTPLFASRSAVDNNQFNSSREVPYAVVDKVKKELLRRGAHGIRGLGIVFRRIDNNRGGALDKNEFEWGLRENGHQLSPLDYERLFRYFDRNLDGKVSYDEFLRALRGDLNDSRKRLVGLAFQKLDKTGDGQVTLDDLVGVYDVSFHPDFRAGKKTREQILQDFASQWDTINKDGKVTLEEFEDYYKDVSASIDRDDYFELMMRNAWKL
jgi:Ca2+-binding EF-hand superfamily protein